MYISSDTNIWFDFNAVGHLDYPFRLQHSYCISQNAFQDEILEADLQDQLVAKGLQLAQVTNEEYQQAIDYANTYPKISTYDALALAIAKQREWTLLTGDGALRKAAEKEHIPCRGTIWVYDQLKETGGLTEAQYYEAIEALIGAVSRGERRLPMVELNKRKRP